MNADSRNVNGFPSVSMRAAVRAGVALLVLGATYLYVVRGPAMLLDLAAGAAGMFCM